MAKTTVVRWKRVTKRRRTVRVTAGVGTPPKRIAVTVKSPRRLVTVKPRRKTLRTRLRKVTRLLSGGNPQIAKGDGDAAVGKYIAAMPGWKRRVGRRLDELIVRAVPDVRKAVRWNSPFYGVPGRGWFLGVHCYTNYVKVGFFRGSSLRPLPPGVSKVKNVRYFLVHEDDVLDEALFTDWVRQASQLPGWDGFSA
jgi:hypothetical protein